MINISGETKQLAVIGNPVSHSFSPLLHNYIIDKMGLDFVYTALNVKNDDFPGAIKGIRALNFGGVNITAPYKTMAYNEMDVLSDKAKMCGSVNTCVNRDGVLYGYTTDADGFYRSLEVEGFSVEGKDVLFVGAGGVTLPVALLLAQKGAKSISIQNRTLSKAEDIAKRTKEAIGFDVNVGIDKEHYDLVINTTTVGMHPDIEKTPIEKLDFVDSDTFVADMIYNPGETLFLKMAKMKGAKTMNGLGMLIFQGILAFELFSGVKVPDEMYKDILKDVFGIEK